jgi:nucleoid DNA-binding protein
MVGLWDSISLVRAVVGEKGNLGMLQFHHNPHPKISFLPSQTNCLNRERNQAKNHVRSLVKSLTPGLSLDQPVSIVSFVGRMVTRRREARMAKEWANKDRYHPSHDVPEPRV